MPEFTSPKPPTPPEPKHTVKAADFIAALKGETTPQKTSLFITTGKKLIERKEFDQWFFNNDTTYLVLYEARIDDTEWLEIVHEEQTDSGKGIVLYKSILPRIRISKTITEDWLLINSVTQVVHIVNNSQAGYISIFNNSQAEEIHIEDNSQARHIRIYNNSQAGDISIDNNSKAGYISIDNNSKAGDISIDNSQAGDISIDNNSQTRDIYFNKKGKAGDIDVDNKSQSGNIWINRDSECGDIQLDHYSQSGEIGLNNNSQCQDIVIKNGSQSGNIRIRESQCSTLQMDSNYAGIELYNASIPQMRVSNCFLPSVSWQAGTKGELYISNCHINHLALNHTALLKDALFSVVDSFVYIAEMNKLAVQGQLLFTNTQPLTEVFEWKPVLKKEMTDHNPADEAAALVKNIHAASLALLEEQENEYNKSVAALKEQFKRLNEKTKVFENNPLWIIANSSLSKTEITGSDLKGFRFEYRDSKILDMFIAGTKMPDGEIEIYETVQSAKATDDIDFFEQQVSVYSQLKKIFDNQGNIVQSTKYHAKAMEKQQRLLEEVRKKDGKGWRSWLSDEGFDLVNFRLNKWSNNHGESWRKALRFVFFSSLGVYILYYISLYYKEPFSFDAWERFAGHFFSFLNIARKEDFMPGGDHTGGLSLFLSFLGRIVTGFGIYQLIAAFRRHGRK